MLVRAKYQFGYKGQAIVGGQFFDLDEKDYMDYRNEVELVDRLPEVKVEKKELKVEKTKNIKRAKVKTK